MRDGNYFHIKKNSYLLTYQFPLQLNQHTDGTMVASWGYLDNVDNPTIACAECQSRVGFGHCCQQADAEPLLACRTGWLIQYCIDLFVTKYDTVSCMNIHEYIYANFERYAGIASHEKTQFSFYWLICSCLDLVSVRVGSVSATCRSWLVPNRFWHVERAGWFNIVADLFVTLIWYRFLHEYTWVYLCQFGKIRSQAFVLTWKRLSFYWLIGSYWDWIRVRSCNGLLLMNTKPCLNWICYINNYVMWDSLANSNYWKPWELSFLQCKELTYSYTPLGLRSQISGEMPKVATKIRLIAQMV